MSTPTASIRIQVDLTNPGQFFACCGLLELATRFWGNAEGWFGNHEFNVACAGDLPTLLSILLMDPPQEITQLPGGLSIKPLIAPLSFSFDGGATYSLTLSSWMTVKVERNEVVAAANPPWNFWSGQQTSLRIWLALRKLLVQRMKLIPQERLFHLFDDKAPLPGRFGFDPEAAWNALDVGFSPNEQGIPVESSAAVELLAAVGLQRFRPQLSEDRQSFIYATWDEPLAALVAASVSASTVKVHSSRLFRGRVVSRGAYAALDYSTPLNTPHND